MARVWLINRSSFDARTLRQGGTYVTRCERLGFEGREVGWCRVSTQWRRSTSSRLGLHCKWESGQINEHSLVGTGEKLTGWEVLERPLKLSDASGGVSPGDVAPMSI